jgi:signal transduction histidine kinase
MKTMRWLPVLFFTLLTILVCMLCWGGYSFYLWQYRHKVQDVLEIADKAADETRESNMILNNLAGIKGDKDEAQKLAFAAGMLGNTGRMSVWFDEDEQRSQERIASQNKAARIHKNGKEVFTVNDSFLKKHDVCFEPSAVKGIGHFDSLFRRGLNAGGLDVKYVIKRISPDNRSLDSNYRNVSPFFIINYYDPKVFYLAFDISPAQIVPAVLPYAVTCFLVVSMLIASYMIWRKGARTQAQMSRFRESLFSNMTHELKTPLSSLQLILDMAVTSEGNTLTKDHLLLATSELDRMKLTIDKILSVGKLNKEQLQLNKAVVDLNNVVTDAVKAMEMAIRKSGAVIKYDAAPKAQVAGDRTLLVNMVTTLIDNAIKYNRNTPAITMALHEAGDHMVLHITDNGIGIDPQYHRRVFEPFFRVPTGDVHEVKGHGLGLSFVAQVAELHDGDVKLANTPGGTTFTIKLLKL